MCLSSAAWHWKDWSTASSFGLLIQARHQYTGESQLKDIDAEACDVCPKEKEKTVKTCNEGNSNNKGFPHMPNQDY